MDSSLPFRPQQPGAATAQTEQEPDMPPLEGDDGDHHNNTDQAPSAGHSSSSPSPTGPANNDGDAFIILNLPKNVTVGCDAKAIGTTGASDFKGIRAILSGPHFIWVSPPGAMSRAGYWFVTTTTTDAGRGRGGGRVRVKQWDWLNDTLADPASGSEVARLLSEEGDMAGLYPQLVPHGLGYAAGAARGPGVQMISSRGGGPDVADEDADGLWRRLTSSVGEKVLARVTGQQQQQQQRGASGEVSEWLFDTSDSARGDGPGFPHATAACEEPGQLDFLFPEGDVDLAALGHEHEQKQKKKKQEKDLGATATASNNDDDDDDSTPDTTTSILRLLDTPGTGITDRDLLGELQLTFLTGLHLSNLACVGQWWHLVLRVVLRAHGLALVRSGLARAFIDTLHAQMVYNEKYIAGGGDPPSTITTRSTTGNGGRGDAEDGDDDDKGDDFGFQQQARREYAGADDQGTSILDIVPGNKRRLRGALALFKRRLDAALSSPPPGGRVTGEQGAVGRAFGELEAWFWRFGWDLRVDVGGGEGRRRARRGGGGDDDDDDDDDNEEDGDLGCSDGGGGGDDDDDDYQPVIVDLDENGREVGLVSFN